MTLQDCQVGMVVRRIRPPFGETSMPWYDASDGHAVIIRIEDNYMRVRYVTPPPGVTRRTNGYATETGVWLTSPKMWDPVGATIDEIDEPPFVGVIP
jgi:hypothetical protein